MGINTDLVYKIGIGGIINGELMTFDYVHGEKLKPYVCAIEGRDFQYGFKRVFAEKVFDKFTITYQERKMSCVKFKIEENIVYEYKRFAGLTHGEIEEGYFAIVDGKIYELEYEEVRHWCGTAREKARSLATGKSLFSPSARKGVPDDIDF